MRIAWITPVYRGAMPRVGASMVAALEQAGVEVAVVGLEGGDDGAAAELGDIERREVWNIPAGVDASVYNFLGSRPLCGFALAQLVRHDCIVIFHGDGRADDADRLAAQRAERSRPLDRDAVRDIATHASGGVILDDAIGLDVVAAACPGPLLLAATPGTEAEADAIAARLRDFLSCAINARPVLRTARRVGWQLESMGVLRGDPLIGRVAAFACQLFPQTLGRSPDIERLQYGERPSDSGVLG